MIPSDWTRFKYYADRIRHLAFSSPCGLRMSSFVDRLDPAVFRAMDQSIELGHFHHPLLANLKDLIWEKEDVSLLEACIFLGPRMTCLTIFHRGTTIGLDRFLKAVETRCPSLSKLRIYGNGDSDPVISKLICDLPCLQEISTPWVMFTPNSLVGLASLPNLSKLHAPISNGSILHQGSFPSSSFHALKDFTAKFASIFDAIKFLQLISTSSSLKSLATTISNGSFPEELHMFFTTVNQSCSRHTLTTFSFYSAGDCIVEAHVLLPLFQCPNIETVEICVHYAQQTIDNAFMKDMALAWPRLRHLNLRTLGSDVRSKSSVDLEGLFHLAQHCHVLESVTHQFNVALPTDPMYYSEENRICHESMRCLNVGYSPVTDPCVVADFLFDIFPNMRLNRYSYDEGDNVEIRAMAKLWGEVNKQLNIKGLAPIGKQKMWWE